MSQSLRIAPPSSHPTSTTNTNLTTSAPSAPGLPDTFRQSSSSSPSPSSTATQSTHPLESRLAAWTTTQETLKHSLLRRNFGLAEPIRRGMELKLVRDAEMSLPGGARSAGVHEDILSGRDTEVSWEDVYGSEGKVVGGEERDGGVHGEMERRVGMGKW